MVEITAYSDEDAYMIFETMNDRGLSLSPTDMLKGYLLANIDEAKRTAANTRWRQKKQGMGRSLFVFHRERAPSGFVKYVGDYVYTRNACIR